MVQKRYPSSELLAAGWSLGGNILVRYLGEEGPNCPISAAASLCNPLDLVSSFQARFPGTPGGRAHLHAQCIWVELLHASGLHMHVSQIPAAIDNWTVRH